MNKTIMSTETKHLLEGRNNYIHIRLRKDLFARYLVIVTMIVTLTEHGLHWLRILIYSFILLYWLLIDSC